MDEGRGTLKRRIMEVERRAAQIDALLSATENEKFAWETLCDIKRRVQELSKHYNVSCLNKVSPWKNENSEIFAFQVETFNLGVSKVF